MRILIFLLFLLPLSLIGQVESQFNGTLNVFSGSRIGSTNTFTISGIFNSTTTSYTSSQSATGDIVQVQSGARFYWLHIYSIASNSGGVITCNVRDSSSTLTVFPLGKWDLFRPTPNLRLPLSPDGTSNASRSATFNTLALRVDEIQTSVTSATNCEQTITKASHGFRKWTPIFWNGSTYLRPTADSIVPDYIVVDSLTANTFKVANCGTYTTALANGLYWYTNQSPGYSLTADTTKVPLFQVLNLKLILNPIVGFNLMSGSGSGNVTTQELADTAAAIRADFPSGGSVTTIKDTLYFLGSGQSGILGATSAYDGDTTSCSCVEIWDEYSALWRRARIGDDPFRTTAHPRSDATYANSNNLMLHFGKAVSAMTGAHVKLILVQEDGNNITGAGAITRWVNPTNRPMLDRITARIDSARAADPGFKELAGFLWHQGEADAVLAAATYQTRFDSLKLLLRTQSWFPTYTPIIVGGLRSGNSTYPQDTASLRKMDWNNDPWVGYAYSDNLTGNGIDVTHFGGSSLVELGKRYFGVWRLLPKRYTELNKDLIDDIAQSSGSTGNIQLANSGAFTSDNALNYDATNDRLRVNKATTASANLDVVGTVVITNTPTVTTGTQGILVTSSPSFNTSSSSYSAQNITSSVSTTSGTTNTFESLTLTPTYNSGFAGAGNTLALRSTNNSDLLTNYAGQVITMSENATVSLANRHLVTATYSKTQNADLHTVTGHLLQFQDNSSTGRINSVTAMQQNIVNARASTGLFISTTNQRGTANVQLGVSAAFATTGAGVQTNSATAYTMSQTDASSGSTTSFFGLAHGSISAANRFFLYNTSLTFPSLHTGQFRVNNSVTTSRLSTKSDAGDTYSFLAQSSGNTNLFAVRESGEVEIRTSKVFSGSGSPEGAVTAPVSSMYLRTDGGAGTSFYAKESGTGNTGWKAAYTTGNILSGSATLDFPSTAVNTVSDLTITVTGAADGDVVSLGVPNAAITATSVYTAWVSAANTVTVRLYNGSVLSLADPASGTFKVTVTK